VRRGNGRIEKLSEDSEQLHVQGLRELIGGRVEASLVTLQKARDLDPDNWRIRNDLAACFLLAGLAGEPVGLLDAFAELATGVELAPEAAPLRFNRALVFELLGLHREAKAEWRVLLELDPSRGWRQEAEEGLSRLRSRLDPEEHRARMRAVLARSHDASLLALVRRSPQDAWSLGLWELLGSWAQAESAGDKRSAEAFLSQTEELAEALAEVSGDAFLLRVAQDAAAMPSRERKRHARVALDYLEGRRHYDAREIAEAELALTRARRGSAALGGPLVSWIDFYLDLCEYWRGETSALEKLQALGQEISGRPYPVLKGYIDWTLGLIHIDDGRFSAGLNAYREGLRGFEAAGMGEEAVMLRVLISDALLRLGEVREAWSEELAALSQVEDFRNPRNLWAALDQAALLATLLGGSEVAPYFYDAALRAAERAPDPLTISNAYVFRANTWSRLGRKSEALQYLQQARRTATTISDPSSRLRADAGIEVAGAKLVKPGAEAEAVRRLGSAVARYRRAETEVLLPEILFERARLLVRMGDPRAGEGDLRKALVILERERRAIDELEWRVSFSSVARPTLDELLRFHLEVSRDLEAVPALTDLARDPAYFAPLSPVALSELPGVDYAEALQLAPGEVLLSVTVLEGRFLLWVLRDGRLSVVTELVAPDELGRRLAAAWARPSLDDLAWFYDRMIRPVAAHLEGGDRLFLALDRGLNLLPVGALYDRESRTSLVERTAVTVVPAALLLAHGAADRRVPVGRVAVVGSPSGEGLPRLAIEAEAAAIAELYPQSRVELGDLGPAELEAAGSWADVLQFSGHAVSNPLVPGLSRLVSGDEPIYARDIRELRMTRARTVILAGCETAATTPQDSSGVLSLAVAFLEAGADWVVASLWPIDDRAARRFTERFHQELRRDPSPDRALRRTQIHFIRSGDSRLEDWAGFQVITG
jgi:tetratricopeptide (TPR) repeat protein